jgi:hypothetical protein
MPGRQGLSTQVSLTLGVSSTDIHLRPCQLPGDLKRAMFVSLTHLVTALTAPGAELNPDGSSFFLISNLALWVWAFWNR